MIVDHIEPNLDDVLFVSYDGELDKVSGNYHGNGSATLDNDCTYQGKFINGMFHGKGKFNWSDGVVFEGDFEMGEMNGKGTYTWQDGSTYQGEVCKGKRHGSGKFTGSGGQTYEGDWMSGLRHGSGKIWYTEDKTSFYSGEWRSNLREGYGLMRYPSGNSYEGMWVADQKSGRGAMIWKDVDEVYTGEWLNGLPHGAGEHIWGDGAAKTVKKLMCNIYRGTFSQGRREGRGTFFYMNGSQYSGEWRADQKHGEGLFVHPDGQIFSGRFELNRMVPLASLNGGDAPLRATDDVSTQYVLHIEDVLERYPVTTDLVDGAMSDDLRMKEVERLLLKYNHCIKQAFKRHSEIANRLRAREVAALQVSASSSSSRLSTDQRVARTVRSVRNFQKRLFCMTLEQMVCFLHECALAGPDATKLNALDVAICLRRMRAQHQTVAAQRMQTYKRQAFRAAVQAANQGDGAEDAAFQAELSELEIELQSAEEVRIASILVEEDEAAGDGDSDLSGDQPLLEREFAELLVRCVAEGAARRGGTLGHMTLFRSLYQVLAEKLLPLVSDWESRSPPFYLAMYSDAVQDVLHPPPPFVAPTKSRGLSAAATAPIPTASDFFLKVWGKVVRAQGGVQSHPKGGSITVRQLVVYLCTLRGSLLAAQCSPGQILAVCTGDSLSSSLTDPSIASRRIGYLDALDLFCRVAVAEQLWPAPIAPLDTTDHVMAAYNAEATGLEGGDNEPSEETKDMSQALPGPPTKERLLERLALWISKGDL